MIRRILVPINDSPASSAALAAAIEIAEGLNATITLMTAVSPRAAAVAGPYGAVAEVLEEGSSAEHKRCSRLLKLAAERIPDTIAFRILLADGDPAAEIIRRAGSGDYDLVVLGARGLGPLKSVLVGGVSRRVVAGTEIPVTVVRTTSEDRAFTDDAARDHATMT